MKIAIIGCYGARATVNALADTGNEPVAFSAMTDLLQAIKLGASADLAILDIGARALSLGEVAAARDALGPMPLLLNVGREEIHNLSAHADLGVFDFITGKVSTEELAARIRMLSDRAFYLHRDEERVDTFEVGPYHFDPLHRIVSVGNKSVRLQPKRFELISLFFHRIGVAITREELYATIWPETTHPTRVLDVAVAALRASLSLKGEYGFAIWPVHGVGYRLHRSKIVNDAPADRDHADIALSLIANAAQAGESRPPPTV